MVDFSACAYVSPESSLFEARLQTEIQDLIGDFVDLNKMGVWIGYKSKDFDAVVSLGSPDGGNSDADATRDIVPAGSLTKPWTAVGVLRLVEDGVIDLDDPISPHVDPFLLKINDTTLEVF